jgi:hypothetical protein
MACVRSADRSGAPGLANRGRAERLSSMANYSPSRRRYSNSPAPVSVLNTPRADTRALDPTPDHVPDARKVNGSAASTRQTFNSNWQRVEKVYTDHFHNPDMQAVKAVYSSFAAHNLAGQPVWPLLVGPPGSLKTVLLMSLDGLPETHIIDTITPKTFISGYKSDSFQEEEQKKSSGLLFRIGSSGKIICPDFSTILSINRDHRASILSDLRRIYDGMLRKEFGMGQDDMAVREWRGRITFMAAGTGDVDRHYSVFASLGERFLLIRWPRAGIDAAKRAVKQDMRLVQREVAEAVHPLFDDLEATEPAVPPNLEEWKIPALGDFIGYCRTQLVRDSRGSRDIIDVPEAESATRISQQLTQLAKGCALLDRRSVVNEDDWTLVKRVAFVCMLPARRKVINALIKPSNVDAQIQCDALPETTRRYASEDLMALGILDDSGEFSEQSNTLLKIVGLL